jgi:hypothetical protein
MEEAGRVDRARPTPPSPQRHVQSSTEPPVVRPKLHPRAVSRPGLLHLQRAAGNRATALAVQRADEKQRQEQLVQDGVKGDTDAIVAITDFSTVSDVDRLTMVFYLTDQLWVGSKSEKALERIWTSFGTRFGEVAAANMRRWNESVHRHSDLPSNLPEAKKVYTSFADDTAAVARGYLDQNMTFAIKESERLGVAPGTPDKPATDAEVNELQIAAAEVAKLQIAQNAARKSWVGWTEEPRPGSGENEHYVRPAQFAPGQRPAVTDLAALPGTVYVYLDDLEAGADWKRVDPSSQPALQRWIKPFDDMDKADADAGAALTGWLTRNPALAAVAIGGADVTSAFASAKGAADAKKLLAEGFATLRKNITDTQNKLRDKDLDPLDLTPIHEKLLAKAIPAQSNVDWAAPFPKAIAQQQTRSHDISRALRTLLLQKIAEMAFLLAPLTGGASLVAVLAVGTTATGANLVLDAQRYAALSSAKGAGAQPGTELVSGAAVDEAEAAVVSDAIAFALAALAMGAALAGKALQSMRAARLDRVAELPEGFITGRVEGLYGAVDPAAGAVGEFRFSNGAVRTEGPWRVVRIEVETADRAGFGHVERAWNPASGEVQYREANLDMIPKDRRWLNTEPPMVAGRGTPLSSYMNLRAMRALGVPPGGIRVMRMAGIENVRSVIQYNRAIQAGLPEDAAAMRTQSTQYGGTAATQSGGGRIVGASIHGGEEVMLSDLLQKWEGEVPDPVMVANHDKLLAEYGLTRDMPWKVRSNFDIELRFADTPVVVPPIRPADEKKNSSP